MKRVSWNVMKKWIYSTWHSPTHFSIAGRMWSISIEWTNTGNNLGTGLSSFRYNRDREKVKPSPAPIYTYGRESAMTRKHSYSGHIVSPCIAVGHPSIQWTTLDEYHKSSCHFRLPDQGQSPSPDENPLPSQRFIKVARMDRKRQRNCFCFTISYTYIYV